MKPIADVYQDTMSEYGFSAPCDYGPLLVSLGHEIVVQVEDDDYQGDSRLLLRDGDRYGVLVFGWGSCSGCDALQASDSLADVEALRDSLAASIEWGDREQTLAGLCDREKWLGRYSWHAEETREFLRQAVSHLGGAMPDGFFANTEP